MRRAKDVGGEGGGGITQQSNVVLESPVPISSLDSTSSSSLYYVI